jgi:hypothetical protein
MTRSKLLAAIGALACIQLAGCSQWKYEMGTHFTKEEIPLSDGSVSLQTVMDRMGPPLHVSATHNGYVMAWEHWLVREDSLGFSLGPLGIDILSIDIGSLTIKGEHVLMAFNQQHMLISESYSAWENRAGGGMAIQPSIGVDVVDAEDLTQALTQHDWGAASLGPISNTLNLQSSPHTGQNGLEQRGTPLSIGQRSLELY